MGGRGSGSYYRWQSDTTKTEETHRIDIRFLKKRGYLSAGTYGTLSMYRKTYDKLVKQECDISEYVDRSINRLLASYPFTA